MNLSFSPTIVSLSESFPDEIPILSLHSIYHKFSGRPFEFILKDMPYSSQWDAEEKAWRMKLVSAYEFSCHSSLAFLLLFSLAFPHDFPSL